MTATRDFPRVNLSLLTDREAMIIQLHYADGWSLRRIGRGIGVNVSTIHYQHERALRVLRNSDCLCLGYGSSNTRRLPSIGDYDEQTEDEGTG